MTLPSTIAIDGPSASGKTTLARALAARLGYLYFDTGVMYRAVTLAVLNRGMDIHDEEAVTKLAKQLTIDIVASDKDDGRQSTVLLDQQDVTWELRTARVDANVSIPSAYSQVREALTKKQRAIGMQGKVVMVGRDIGTVVLPDADLKIYLDASVEARARRRWIECQRIGRDETYEDILAAMRLRDEKDSGRAVAPLRPAEDAILYETTDRSADQVLEHFLRLIQNGNGADAHDPDRAQPATG